MSWTDVPAAVTGIAVSVAGIGAGGLDPTHVDWAGWRAVGRGVLLGLGAAMPLGPVNVEIARRVLRSGFAAGVALGLGAVTVDVAYALVSAFSFVRLDDKPWVAHTVGAVGVCFLLYLGVQCLRAARSAWRHDPLAEAGEAADAVATPLPAGVIDYTPADPTRRPTGRSAYVTGLLMTLLNPMTLVFWFTVVPATGGAVAGATSAPGAGPDAALPQAAGNDLPMMCAGVFIGTAAWVFTFASLLSAAAAKAGARRPNRRRIWLATADAVGGLTLLGFAAAAFLRLVRSIP